MGAGVREVPALRKTMTAQSEVHKWSLAKKIKRDSHEETRRVSRDLRNVVSATVWPAVFRKGTVRPSLENRISLCYGGRFGIRVRWPLRLNTCRQGARSFVRLSIIQVTGAIYCAPMLIIGAGGARPRQRIWIHLTRCGQGQL